MSMTHRYSRDLLGYGPRSPLAAWPGGAKIAVQIVLNYEEGGEYSLEHGDHQSEAFLSDVIGASNWQGQRHWNIETMYDYGARVGFWRLHRVLADLPVTVFGVTAAMARGPEQVRAMKDAGWEIASHGLRWIEYKDFSEAEERAHMNEAIELHRQITGRRPKGWYTGRCSMQTVNLAAEDGGFDWVADSYADELPYWHHHQGRDQLIVPYTLDANDARFIGAQGFSNAEDYFVYLRDVFDTLYEDGEAGHPKIMSLGLHCRLAGKPGRIAGLKRFLAHAQSKTGVWFATRGQIAQYWRETHPPATNTPPHEMDRETFVAAYGDVFEHSPWVAEHTHRLELGAAHSSAVGLASAMARAFRAAPEDKRLATLKAHPDLAGKLAAAKRLTDASTAEQASAGLDALTDTERETFTKLNDRYTQTFGFPFIIAVRDHTKESILEAFERRITNDRQAEFHEACEQVIRIAELRLMDRLA